MLSILSLYNAGKQLACHISMYSLCKRLPSHQSDLPNRLLMNATCSYSTYIRQLFHSLLRQSDQLTNNNNNNTNNAITQWTFHQGRTCKVGKKCTKVKSAKFGSFFRQLHVQQDPLLAAIVPLAQHCSLSRSYDSNALPEAEIQG